MLSAAFDLNFLSFAALFIAFALGGILKGATGAGAPVVAIPVLTIFFNVQLAVILMVMPNLVSNIIQIIHYRKVEINLRVATRFAGSGALGCILGTFVLANASSQILEIIVAFSTVLYIIMRFLRPNLELPRHLSNSLSVPLGFAGGMIQGSAGVSAPLALSFLNAMGMSRESFILTISSF
ncbi:MAG: sulfite exporter TauE/SafE family protein, partial [Paracoccaceae bacterium]|nr:sulfite exporter TauE/SafE family protein [Paracoccaceae bacterium]